MQDHAPLPRRRTRLLSIIARRLTTAALLGLLLLSGLVGGGVVVVPRHLNPFVPLRVADDVNWLTRIKLSRLEHNGPQCLSVLADADVSFTPVADDQEGQGCILQGAVQVKRASRALSDSFTASCPLAVAWALFDEHVIGPAARRHLGLDVVRVIHVGSYACRNINHRVTGRRSEHATANAIDIVGFVLADGQEVTLRRDWSEKMRHARPSYVPCAMAPVDSSMLSSAPIIMRRTATTFISTWALTAPAGE